MNRTKQAMRRYYCIGVALFLLNVLNCNTKSLGDDTAMKLISPGFKHNELIPKKFTCQGQNVNPALLIENIPPGTQTLALIVDDPDAPATCWVHWVVFNISPTKEIAERSVPGTEGHNDFGRLAYGGPCPPSGTHRYFFKLYALDAKLALRQGATKEELNEAMQGHIIGRTQLIGLYRKQ